MFGITTKHSNFCFILNFIICVKKIQIKNKNFYKYYKGIIRKVVASNNRK